MEAKVALRVLAALGHESRLAAFRQLVQVGAEGMPVGELRDRLGLAPATLTAHLNVLRAAGLVLDTREGRVIRVRANYLQMNDLVGFLTENCCGGGSSCAPSCPPPRRKEKP
jgi:ArsR family transcriptional regulator